MFLGNEHGIISVGSKPRIHYSVSGASCFHSEAVTLIKMSLIFLLISLTSVFFLVRGYTNTEWRTKNRPAVS